MAFENVVILYKSKYGSSKKYASWIKDELKCDMFEKDKVSLKDLKKYDSIIYVGGVYSNSVNGFDSLVKKFDELINKEIILVAVGFSLGNENEINKIKDFNLKDALKNNVTLFYLRGGFDFEKLKFFDKTAMKLLRNRLVNKNRALTEEERFLLSCYEKSHDWTNKKSLDKILDYINKKTIKTKIKVKC
ncbi:flavodoxin domain-containing protein [Clostridium sp.]|uniref:flavodoxin domain-containing protein n=1 Tax=Clostridium sp. TaxID=1506 RepID=UPI0026DB9A03|nr:flavodoxin domain-containing protein [Clostridium sp.]MDO5039116.1 flavodoxin domain-containing protein [Clostridium sp.]